MFSIYDDLFKQDFEKEINFKARRPTVQVEPESEPEEDPKKEIKELKEKKDRDPELYKIYKKIAMKTHPDRVGSEDLVDTFNKATQAINENDWMVIMEIASELEIKTPKLTIELRQKIKNNIAETNQKIKKLQNTTAWVWANLVAHDWMLGMFPIKAQDEIWQEDPNTLIGSALIYPCGKAEVVDGGYRLSGRWPFSSGIAPCDWAMLGGIVQTDIGVEPHIFNIRRKDIKVIETWDVSGLVGTGSEDVACEDVFVPRHMALPLRDTRGGPTPGSAVNSHPIYQMPLLALFPHVIAGVLLGIARAAFDDYVENTKSRFTTYNQGKLADYTNQQMRISEAGASIDAARLLLRDNCLEAERKAAEIGACTEIDKARWRRDGAYAANLCAKGVDQIFAAAGGGQRDRRDHRGHRHLRCVAPPHGPVGHVVDQPRLLHFRGYLRDLGRRRRVRVGAE